MALGCWTDTRAGLYEKPSCIPDYLEQDWLSTASSHGLMHQHWTPWGKRLLRHSQCCFLPTSFLDACGIIFGYDGFKSSTYIKSNTYSVPCLTQNPDPRRGAFCKKAS